MEITENSPVIFDTDSGKAAGRVFRVWGGPDKRRYVSIKRATDGTTWVRRMDRVTLVQV